jgi:hypothetical protein
MPPKQKKNTRQASSETFAGGGAKLPDSDLPTHGDVARFFYFLQDHESDYASQMSLIENELQQVWSKCNPMLPLISKESIHTKLRRFLDKVKMFDRKRITNPVKKVLVAKKDRLFDISACSCELKTFPCDSPHVRCTAKDCKTSHIICVCPPQYRVPAEEREYLIDQRQKIGTKGSYQMRITDRIAAAKQRAREKRQAKPRRHPQHMDQILVNTNVSFGVSSVTVRKIVRFYANKSEFLVHVKLSIQLLL